MDYRALTQDEINRLIAQGCTADDWAHVEVAQGFEPDYLCAVKFTGHNRLGVCNEEVALHNNLRVHSGMYSAWLHNCTIGHNVFIRNVRQYISNYIIDDDTIICDIGVLAVTGVTAFGNDVEVCAVNESGTHCIPLYDELSAQLAYLLVAERARKDVVGRVSAWIKGYGEKIKSDRGTIARHAAIYGCATIINVRIGEKALLENVLRLNNGSVLSNPEAPVYIGSGCSCENFIIQSGASLNNGVLLSHCLIGQGGVFDKQFSAEHSLFFANCQGFHGEATAVFAGPHTVTHHKSTLLIAGLFSFMNAGSGANQSNHAYKLGPIHHGLVERGVKLASDSYLFWPAHISAFTLVSGRHSKHPDCAAFPFSYLVEKDGYSQVVPGVNFLTVGTWRDAQKWPQRDRRKGMQIDRIHYRFLNPYIIGRVQKGKEAIETLAGCVNCSIDPEVKKRGVAIYDFAETLFLLTALVERLENCKGFSQEALQQHMAANGAKGSGEWMDIAGLLCPEKEWENLLAAIEQGTITRLTHIEETLEKIYRSYAEYEWNWVVNVFENKCENRPGDLSPEGLIYYLDEYKKIAQQYTQHLCRDARKEFAGNEAQALGSVSSWETNETVWELLEQQEKRDNRIQQLKNKWVTL